MWKREKRERRLIAKKRSFFFSYWSAGWCSCLTFAIAVSFLGNIIYIRFQWNRHYWHIKTCAVQNEQSFTCSLWPAFICFYINKMCCVCLIHRHYVPMLNAESRKPNNRTREREDEEKECVSLQDECRLLKMAVKSLCYSSGNSLCESNSELKALHAESPLF